MFGQSLLDGKSMSVSTEEGHFLCFGKSEDNGRFELMVHAYNGKIHLSPPSADCSVRSTWQLGLL